MDSGDAIRSLNAIESYSVSPFDSTVASCLINGYETSAIRHGTIGGCICKSESVVCGHRLWFCVVMSFFWDTIGRRPRRPSHPRCVARVCNPCVSLTGSNRCHSRQYCWCTSSFSHETVHALVGRVGILGPAEGTGGKAASGTLHPHRRFPLGEHHCETTVGGNDDRHR